MPPTGFEPTIPASELPQNYALDGAATGIESHVTYEEKTTHVYENAHVKETTV